MENNVDIVNFISSSLDSGNYKDALNVPNDEKYTESFKNNCWDLISVIVDKIQDDTLIIKPSLYGACEQMLSLVINKCSPEEALLEFIERVELAKNDAQFGIVLPALLMVLKKLTAKRERSLEWCLNSIATYIESIPLSEHHLESDERKLIDSDPNFRRVIKVYSILPTFYRPFIEELSAVSTNPNVKTKQIITAFLISLLGKPMIYIDIDANSNEKSEARQICDSIIQDICILEKDIFKFLKYLEICIKEKPKPSEDSDNEESHTPYEHREKINMTTLSGFFYCTYSGNFTLPDTAIAQVYSINYVVHSLMLAVNHLLSFTEYGPLDKAQKLLQALDNRLCNHTSHTLLASSIHFVMIKKLVNVAIFSKYESIRKEAVNSIGRHINKFDYEGRCSLIKYLIEASNHSGMIGYAITLYKSALTEGFNAPKLNKCFSGVKLNAMIKKICHLPHGAESDLVELADQIITTLNFLRFLILKDTKNKTGIRDMFQTIETEYLDTLRTALKLSKAHYELNLRDLKEGKDFTENKNVEVTLNIGGNVLDSIPSEKKQQIIESALNCFHLIESLTARVTEFINANQSYI